MRPGISVRILTGVCKQAGHLITASIKTRLLAWWKPFPDHVVIGTLRTTRLAVEIRAQVARDQTQPPIQTFLDRLSFCDPYCPRCSLPLDPLYADISREGVLIGYQCRPCDTQIRWKPADVLKQVKREVRRHYVDYWRTYQDAIHQR